ncbi:CooT family nickel-binding protein [Methanolobus bombayensis]|uniref:CooT family nickel-binding protein n=1 Tax=Methanolobus bombayensis TaxID=38023 RepID=UPI001AE89326|nr:CooT family nickel-binding protein [Methanolobus bombayensis]MBP1909005.1 putative RNA-binding protein [Methanolobus bombayensis]
MCELKVILVDGNSRETVMESVTRLVVDGDSVTTYGIFGESETVKGSVKEINFGTGEAILHK